MAHVTFDWTTGNSGCVDRLPMDLNNLLLPQVASICRPYYWSFKFRLLLLSGHRWKNDVTVEQVFAVADLPASTRAALESVAEFPRYIPIAGLSGRH